MLYIIIKLLYIYLIIIKFLNILIYEDYWGLGIGDWGLGDWGLGVGDWV